MPYDDPFLSELGGYLKAAEPGQRERADAWATAIGILHLHTCPDIQGCSAFCWQASQGQHPQARMDPARRVRDVRHAETLKASLARCFTDEREFDYSRLSARKMIPHFCRFIAQIWQIHPFGEGNTRTTAVFAIKYLRSLGFRAENNMFKDNSWYFRNALVRANFAGLRYDAKRDWSFLEAFFRNLLLGEDNLLKSRLMLIGMNERERKAMMASLGIVGEKVVGKVA